MSDKAYKYSIGSKLSFSFLVLMVTLLSAAGCKQQNVPMPDVLTTIVEKDTLQPKAILQDTTFFKKVGNAYVLPWSYMLNTKLEQAYSDTLGMEVSLPTFSDTLLWLNHKNVIVEGFFIPVDETGDAEIVILSAYPYTQCFFCGKAGVESIMDVLPKEKLPNIKMDQKLKMKGRLKLNREDFNFLIFMLEDAVRVKN